MKLALRTRLTLFYTAILAVLLTALSVISYRVLSQQLDANVTENLTELTSGLHGYLHVDNGVPVVVFDRNDEAEAAFVHEATRYYQMYDADTGALIAQSEALGPLGLRFTPSEARAFRDQARPQDIRTDFGRMRLSNSIVSLAGHPYLLQVGAPLVGMDATLDRFLRLLLWSVPLGLLAAVLAGRWMAGIALAPLSRLAGDVRSIDVTNLRQRLPIAGAGDELDEVAHAFNRTLVRLEHAVGEMRQFSTALAHELRTPLAALRGEIELAMLDSRAPDEARQRFASQVEEIDKLKRLIDRLLTLARAEAGEIPLARDRVNLEALSRSVAEQIEPVAKFKAIDLRCECEEAIVCGDAAWLERLLLNLLDNALKFTPPHGSVLLQLAQENGRARIQVRDTGVGISPAVVPHIFERFFRADPARSPSTDGVGLGLSLVKWIVDRHNGHIDVESQPGKGSVFTVRLPLY